MKRAAIALCLAMAACQAPQSSEPGDECATAIERQRVESYRQCVDLLELIAQDCVEWDINQPGGWEP